MSIQVGKHTIGPGHPTFIIAEIGSNWTSLEDCLHSIVQAKLAGADAVKFQLFDNRSLYGDNAHFSVIPINNPGHCPHLNPSWLPHLKREADRVGIEFMCSAFSPELYDVVDPFVSIHKVASAELTHKRILEKFKALGKPVILSTGACTETEIGMALYELRGTQFPHPEWQPQVVLMYCVAAYPAQEIHLDGIHWLKNTFGVPVGYSDHSTDCLIIPNAAVNTGACVLEKHVTFIDAHTPDSPHSLNGDQFKRMVSIIRGELPFVSGPTPAEKGMITTHKRRLIATRDIQPGDTLFEGVNFGIYRSLKAESKAMHGFSVDEAQGKTAKTLILAGDGIAPSELCL